MGELVSVIEKLGFVNNGESYVNDKKFVTNENYSFKFHDGLIYCYKNDNEVLFSIDQTISIGCFLVLLQEYGVYHERYIYERLDVIEEEFWDEEFEEEDFE